MQNLNAVRASIYMQMSKCHLHECLLALHWVHRQGTHPSTIPDCWKSVIFDVVLNFLNKPLFECWATDYTCYKDMSLVKAQLLLQRIMGRCWLKVSTIHMHMRNFCNEYHRCAKKKSCSFLAGKSCLVLNIFHFMLCLPRIISERHFQCNQV